MPSYSIASGSYDGHARIYDVRTGKTTVDVLAHPVTSVRCSSDGNALLASTLDGYIRLLDRMDGKLLNAFGGEKAVVGGIGKPRYSYRNAELRVRSVFAMGDAVVLSGSEEGVAGAAAFAWDVVKGEVIAAVPVGEKVKAVSCVAWNEGVGDWAAGCSDGEDKDCVVWRVGILADCWFRYCQGLRMNLSQTGLGVILMLTLISRTAYAPHYATAETTIGWNPIWTSRSVSASLPSTIFVQFEASMGLVMSTSQLQSRRCGYFEQGQSEDR